MSITGSDLSLPRGRRILVCVFMLFVTACFQHAFQLHIDARGFQRISLKNLSGTNVSSMRSDLVHPAPVPLYTCSAIVNPDPNTLNAGAPASALDAIAFGGISGDQRSLLLIGSAQDRRGAQLWTRIGNAEPALLSLGLDRIVRVCGRPGSSHLLVVTADDVLFAVDARTRVAKSLAIVRAQEIAPFYALLDTLEPQEGVAYMLDGGVRLRTVQDDLWSEERLVSDASGYPLAGFFVRPGPGNALLAFGSESEPLVLAALTPGRGQVRLWESGPRPAIYEADLFVKPQDLWGLQVETWPTNSKMLSRVGIPAVFLRRFNGTLDLLFSAPSGHAVIVRRIKGTWQRAMYPTGPLEVIADDLTYENFPVKTALGSLNSSCVGCGATFVWDPKDKPTSADGWFPRPNGIYHIVERSRAPFLQPGTNTSYSTAEDAHAFGWEVRPVVSSQRHGTKGGDAFALPDWDVWAGTFARRVPWSGDVGRLVFDRKPDFDVPTKPYEVDLGRPEPDGSLASAMGFRYVIDEQFIAKLPSSPSTSFLNELDPDGDGIPNKDDQCPGEAGVPPHGCPDQDGDGVPDRLDRCPSAAGPPPSGCGDADGDGVTDERDACPLEPGVPPTGCPADNGCPKDAQCGEVIYFQNIAKKTACNLINKFDNRDLTTIPAEFVGLVDLRQFGKPAYYSLACREGWELIIPVFVRDVTDEKAIILREGNGGPVVINANQP